jgi:hypothetical protein
LEQPERGIEFQNKNEHTLKPRCMYMKTSGLD